VNEEQQGRFLRKIQRALWNLKGKNLAILGLAFKNGTDDVRESPAIAIVKSLLREGCTITAYDPAAMVRAADVLPERSVRFAPDAYEALRGADACVILTEWEDFGALDLVRMKELMRYPIVVDGRNMFSPDRMAVAGLNYYSVGRPDVIGARRSSVLVADHSTRSLDAPNLDAGSTIGAAISRHGARPADAPPDDRP